MNKYVFCDIDGVLTSGKKTYAEDGMPVHKEYFDKDFTALKEFAAAGFKIYFVSSDKFVNSGMARNRNYHFVYTRGVSKADAINELLEIKPTDTIIAFGDDLFDISMLEIATHRVCPKNANFKVKKLCDGESHLISKHNGGEGVIQDAAEHFHDMYLSDVTLEMIEMLDKKEVF